MPEPRSWASDETARRTMIANRRRDTKPELEVRRRLHAAGLRYRVDHRLQPPLKARPDVVFTKSRIAVFIDGCFWHSCPLHASAPKRNSSYWGPKLERNRQRDRATDSALREAGWQVLRFWEHEDPQGVAEEIIRVVREEKNGTMPPQSTMT